MSKVQRYLFLGITILLLVVLIQPDLWAQCPMCRMTAEGNLKGGGTAGRGLNQGILYMLSMPYIIVGVLAYVWWRSHRSDKSPSSNP